MAGWNIPIFLLLKYIGSFRGPHFPATAMLDARVECFCATIFFLSDPKGRFWKNSKGRSRGPFLKQKNKVSHQKYGCFFGFHRRIPAHHVIHISYLEKKNLTLTYGCFQK